MENPAQGGICKNLVDSIKKKHEKELFYTYFEKACNFFTFQMTDYLEEDKNI